MTEGKATTATPRTSGRRTSLGLLFTFLGAIALCPVASCSSLAWLRFRHEASATAPLRDVQDLLRNPPGIDEAVQVDLTPDASRAIPMEIAHSDEAALIPVVESNKLALLVLTDRHHVHGTTTLWANGDRLPNSAKTRFVIHKGAVTPLGEHYWGVPRRDLQVFVLEDPRIAASSEASVTKTVALIAAPLGLLLLAVGRVILRRAPKQRLAA